MKILAPPLVTITMKMEPALHPAPPLGSAAPGTVSSTVSSPVPHQISTSTMDPASVPVPPHSVGTQLADSTNSAIFHVPTQIITMPMAAVSPPVPETSQGLPMEVSNTVTSPARLLTT